MTDMEKLIEAMEAGTADDIWGLLPECLHKRHVRIVDAYYGSLDAAKALHDALLPEWDWSVKETVEGWLATVSKPINIHTQTEVSFDNGARAWLLAVLRAYAARDAA